MTTDVAATTAAPAPATGTVPAAPADGRTATTRRYLMCRPTHFDVVYTINPWMHPEVPVDHELVMSQWETLRRTYLELGHEVEVIEGAPGLPDMVFAANGATVVDGKALAVSFHYPQRRGEAQLYADWLRADGFEVTDAVAINEGEGDFLTVGRRMIAATGFRSDPASHAELAAVTGLEVVSLELVDPRFYHVDTALTVLDERTVAYLPEAFPREPRAPAGAVPGRDPRQPRRRAGLRAERRLGRPQRRRRRPGHRLHRRARGRRLPARPGRPVRAAQGRRRHQVLHARAAPRARRRLRHP
ncbi:hypothetical protein GCM10025875_00540 [Litorihabitans aurantiacus]|uniref:Amidinotransferase n=1 Tax=Litorihabitans aurantiacus TaxID=1930061 RepID=A0AA37XDM0_9MICO|nr:hypothetical protein GCM10025875_00540 [Litorihabitans aurantiacus]